VTLRVAFDLDGVLADMDSAIEAQSATLLGPPRARGKVGPRRHQQLWRRVAAVEDFWQTLAEIEPGAVRRLATVATARKWEVIFLTRRPETAGSPSQVQSQRWLVAHGFDRPSVFVVQGSRGLIAAALQLDAVVDDRLDNCCDVIADSTARALLVWRGSREQVSASAARVGVGVVTNVAECLDTLILLETGARTESSG
jgi:hypothetical protein